jgi:hypothetical protein
MCRVSLLVALWSFARDASAQSECPTQGTGVYFGNGVNVTAVEADRVVRDALPDLAQQAGVRGPLAFGAAYNQTNGLFLDLIETLKQKAAEDSRFSWFMLNNIVGYVLRGVNVPTRILDRVPGGEALVTELQDLVNASLAEASGQSTAFYDADVDAHSASYASDLRLGYRVMVVAHSQGNLYANAARERLGSLVPGLTSSFGIDAVATPAATAANGYITSNTDLVIGLLRKLGRTVLPANVTVPVSANDLLGHGFLEVYINDALPARRAVLSVLSSLDAGLSYPPAACLPAEPDGAPSLYGAYVKYEGHCCSEPISDATRLGAIREATIGGGVEFADLSGVRDGIHTIAADIDIGASRIDIVYNESSTSSPGAFNGYRLELSGADVPAILGAEFGSDTTVDLASSSLEVEGNTLFINVPSTRFTVGSRISVLLTLE